MSEDRFAKMRELMAKVLAEFADYDPEYVEAAVRLHAAALAELDAAAAELKRKCVTCHYRSTECGVVSCAVAPRGSFPWSPRGDDMKPWIIDDMSCPRWEAADDENPNHDRPTDEEEATDGNT